MEESKDTGLHPYTDRRKKSVNYEKEIVGMFDVCQHGINFNVWERCCRGEWWTAEKQGKPGKPGNPVNINFEQR